MLSLSHFELKSKCDPGFQALENENKRSTLKGWVGGKSSSAREDKKQRGQWRKKRQQFESYVPGSGNGRN